MNLSFSVIRVHHFSISHLVVFIIFQALFVLILLCNLFIDLLNASRRPLAVVVRRSRSPLLGLAMAALGHLRVDVLRALTDLRPLLNRFPELFLLLSDKVLAIF